MRNFSTFPASNYKGTPFAFPVQLSAGLRNMVVPLTLNWTVYGAATAAPNQLVHVDMTGNNVAVQTGTLQSVFIDNLGSNVSVYVKCLDTGYTVAAQPNSCGWYPIYSNLMRFDIIGMGFADGSIPVTGVLFSNLRIIPSIDIEIATSIALYLASSSITRGTGIQNTNYGAPALGDQTITYQGSVAAGNTVFQNNLWGTPLASGFVYLTHIYALASSTVNTNSTWILQSTTGPLTLFTFVLIGGLSAPGTQTLLNLSGMNIKLDATQTWQLKSTGVWTGTVSFVHTFNFTTNQN